MNTLSTSYLPLQPLQPIQEDEYLSPLTPNPSPYDLYAGGGRSTIYIRWHYVPAGGPGRVHLKKRAGTFGPNLQKEPLGELYLYLTGGDLSNLLQCNIQETVL